MEIATKRATLVEERSGIRNEEALRLERGAMLFALNDIAVYKEGNKARFYTKEDR